MGSPVVQTLVRGDEGEFDFPENIALALAVCEYLGVPRQTALRGMEHFHRDPYALSTHVLGEGAFVNGLSINDRQSICMIWEKLCCQHDWEDRELILLVNNRGDRASRTQDMLWVCGQLRPQQVWLMGASRGYMKGQLKKKLPGAAVRELSDAALMPTDLTKEQVIFAVGNLAGEGRALIARVREEGTDLV